MSIPARDDATGCAQDEPRTAPAETTEAIEGAALARAHLVVQPDGEPFLAGHHLASLERDLGRAQKRLRLDAGPSGRVAAEWLLDNDYLIRRVLAQLRRDLPPGFQRRLPRLAEGGQPRALVIAKAFYDGSALDLDLEELERFLESYQAITPLTIAEGWALPALLRLVILRHLLAGLVTPADERDGEAHGTVEPDRIAGRGVRALRLLAEIDWRDVFCRLSVTERLLGQDPAGAYRAMDFDTRDMYRRAIEEVARTSGLTEVDVTRAVLERARVSQPDGRRDHVGYWLLDPGRRAFEDELGSHGRRSLDRRLIGFPYATLLGLLAVAQLAFLAPVLAYLIWLRTSVPLTVMAIALCWIPASLPAGVLVHWLLARVLRPRLLPKMDFSAEIPRRWRTLVAVPTLLAAKRDIDELVSRMEVHYLANPDPELRFALLTDYPDTEGPPDDRLAARLSYAERKVEQLNARYASTGVQPFHLLHRASLWNPAEGRWMGWERKRGKLAELNRYLRGETGTSYVRHVGDPHGLDGVAFVITLDSDTTLTPDAAIRLVGALAHPVNRPAIDAEGCVQAGYTVIQPRVAITPSSSSHSLFSRLFSGDTGIDIYTRAVSEVYQDLFGDGIYVGKGIYDVDGFAASLAGRVPENALLSHDLFEGIQGRTALATDIVIYEDYPPHYVAYLDRVHRWVRGDWQLVPWLLRRVPGAGSDRRANDLGALGLIKIADNLRRSLFAPAVMALLLAGWFLLPGHAGVWTLCAFLAPGTAAVWSTLQRGSLPRRDLGRWLLSLGFAPQEAGTALDAIWRVLVRLVWTRKGLLEWTTAAQAARRPGPDAPGGYIGRLWLGPATAVGVGAILALRAPATLVWAAPWLLLWLASPEIARRISVPRAVSHERLDEAAVRYLRHVARRTWLFYETYVGPNDHWLPPDHFQEDPLGEPAHRTSPTNIGMLLLSELAAYDLGYLGPVGLASWVSNTLDTLERLERYRGHIYNWYDTQTLEPLEPRYVSTVDSGNLTGALVAVAIGCERLATKPPLPPQLRLGLLDSAELLAEAVEAWVAAGHSDAGTEVITAARAITALFDAHTPVDAALVETAATGRAALESRLLASMRGDRAAGHAPSLLREVRVWLDRLGHQLTDAAREVDTQALGSKFVALGQRARHLADAARFDFLYDRKRRWFHVGFNLTADCLDPHHYDLLSSEARLASFLAIALRQVPLRHWFALGRPLARAGSRGRCLLSWGGSMFEYLMPTLLMRSHDDTLLQESYKAAVDTQMAFGRAHGIPWGISESGYALLDGHQAYQYRAFGVPGLGLRRGLEEDLVVAPYASLLALPFRPAAVVDNLRALESLGMSGRFGFYEAADFRAARDPGRRPARVRSYMAHHQGMSLVAIDNHLNGDPMVDRFHGDARIAGSALLLDERVPVDMPVEPVRPEPGGTADVAQTSPPVLPAWRPDRDTTQVWAIGNDALTTLVAADGGSGLQWRDYAISRCDPDPTGSTGGAAVYLRDLESGEMIGATPRPVGDWPDDGAIRFDAGAVEFHRRHEALTIRLRITVAAGADAELRQIEIANEGDRTRRIRIVGCLEPILEPTRDAARHPTFSKLFLRSTARSDLGAVLVSRIATAGPPPPLVLYRMIGDVGRSARVLTIDRTAFLGRRGSFRAPVALDEAVDESLGATLDPLCACALDLDVLPGSSRSVGLVTVVASSEAEALALGGRFGSMHAIRWAFEDAGHAAARRVERLAMPPQLLPAAQRLLSALRVPDVSRRAPDAILRAGAPNPRGLWGRGISGDDPIALVRLDSGAATALAAEVLAVHRYLRALGIRVDLVLLDAAPSGYSDAGSDAVRRLLAKHDATSLLHQRGGIHFVPSDQTGDQEVADLCASAHVYLDAARGTLAAQLAEGTERPAELPAMEPAGPPPGAPPDPVIALEMPELTFDNGFGGFDGDEYVIRPGAIPPAPWINVIANEQFGCLASEAAMGSSWALNASENRLTPWRNDPVVDPASEALYLRDEETARVWSTTPQPAGVPTLVRHGHGYTSYRGVCAGFDHVMTIFVPVDLPVKVVRLRIRNAASRPRRVTATYYAEWVLGRHARETRAYVSSEVAAAEACLLARTAWSIDFAGRVAFLGADRSLHGFTADRVEMLGREGDMSRPAGLARWGLAGRIGPGLDPCAAVQMHLDLGPGEETEICFFLGQAEDRERALEIVRRLREPDAVDQAWRASRATWNDWLDAVRIRTPDAALDRLCNRWLLYQSLASRFFGRTALYQSSGAFGFRDQLQDALAFVHCAPALTRQHILEAASHQFAEGDVLHWWHPPRGAGVRTRCSDDLLWLVYTTAEYVCATGDAAVLAERVPFLTGDPLSPREKSRYGRFAAAGSDTLLEHCRRAVTRGFTAGAHGLPLMDHGDWNDGMNQVGALGRGESVWLGWFLYACVERLARLLERVGDGEEAHHWRERLPALARALSEHGWDGEWYRRAYHDDGSPMGSAHSAPPHIDSIAQSWSVLSGAGDPVQIERALASADDRLVREEERLVLLLTPPFAAYGPDPGYIAAYPPGVRENGGQYTHAAAWLGWAHAARGDGRAAHRIFRLINPIEHTRSAADVARYRVEPYVQAADVYAEPPWIGRGGWTWYSGAAAWTWRLAIEAILGLRRRDSQLVVEPCLPPDWPGFEAWVRRGEVTVHVVVHNGDGHGIRLVHLDGRPVTQPSVSLDGEGQRRLELWLGAERPRRADRKMAQGSTSP